MPLQLTRRERLALTILGLLFVLGLLGMLWL